MHEEIVYKDQLKEMDDRVKVLEQKHTTSYDTSNFEARIDALELKYKNIGYDLDNGNGNETLTLKQPLTILENKLSNIIQF